MSLQSTFWHKGQRDTIGSHVIWADPTVANGSPTSTIDWVAFNYLLASTNGKVNLRTAGNDFTLTAGGDLGAPSTANPTKTLTDDSSSSARTVRQSIAGLNIPAGSFAKCVLTVDGSAQIRGYAGEIVTVQANARFPELDLDSECPFWAMEVQTADFTFGATDGSGVFSDATGYAVIGMP